MSKYQEHIEADLLRTMYRLGLIDFNQLDRLIDELQLLLFTREGYTRRSTSMAIIV